jgi:nucleotide-binding universal stress UspA family protein
MGTIVCAVDDSPEAAQALRVAAHLSNDAGLRLVIVYVEDTVGAGSAVRATAYQRGRDLLDRVLATQAVNGGTDRRVEVGNRSSELARVAEEEAASLIVLGSRSKRWWPSRRTSRLAATLNATADCPVLVAPPPSRR